MRFLDPEIHCTRNVANLIHELTGKREVSCSVRTANLNVDRGRQPEVKNLCDDIGGGEPDTDVWKIMVHASSDNLDEFIRWIVVFVERNQNVAVGRAHRSSGVVGDINAAVGNSQIIDNAV